MGLPLRLLLVEDNDDDAFMLKRELERGGFELHVRQVMTAQALEDALERETWDVVIADYSLPSFDAPAALEMVRRRLPDIPFIIVSGTIRENEIVACMRNGATDFFIKGRTTLLPLAVEREIHAAEERRRRNAAEAHLRDSERRLGQLFQSSPVPYSVTRVRDQLIIEVNRAYTELTGYSAEELIGHTVMEIGLWADENERRALIEALKGPLPVRNFEFKARAKNGDIADILLTADIIEFHGEPCVLSMALDITERKRAEEANRLQAQLLDAVGQAVIVTDRHGIVRFWNHGAEMMYGWKAEEAIGKSSYDLIAVDAASAPSEHIRATVQSRDMWSGEFLVRSKGNRELPVLVTVAPLNDDTGMTGAVGIATDISALKAIEARLRESEELHRVMLENISDAVLMIGDDGRFTFVSPSVEAIFGYSAAEVAEMPGVEALLGRRIPEIDQLGADGELNNLAFDYVARNGQTRHITGYVKRVTIGAGRYLLILRDMTEHRQAVEALRSSELRFRLITENARDLYLLTDLNGRCVYASPTYERLLGYSPASLVGTYPYEKLPHPDDWTVGPGWDNVKGWKQLQPTRGRLRAADGSWVWVEGYTYVISMEGRDYIVGIGRDISERLQLEEERLERERLVLELEHQKELNDLKARFVSMVSHEFRTPLAAIQTSSDLLKHYHDRMSEERRNEHLTQIGNQVRQLTGLLDEVLTLSRADSVRLTVTPVPTPMTEFIPALVADIEQATAAQGRVQISVEPGLEAEVDRKLFGQALGNLLGNALKYSPSDSTVCISARRAGDELVVEVADKGIGIPESDRIRLFEAFHRAGNVGAIPGTGLGLAIVKRAIEGHGGGVSLTSAEGKGSTFTVRVPLVAESARPDAETTDTA